MVIGGDRADLVTAFAVSYNTGVSIKPIPKIAKKSDWIEMAK